MIQLSTTVVSRPSTSTTALPTQSTSSLLPAHRFTVGDEVEIRGKSSGSSANNCLPGPYVKSLRKEIRTREEAVVQNLIMSANVVHATTVGASNRILDHGNNDPHSSFDLVVSSIFIKSISWRQFQNDLTGSILDWYPMECSPSN